MSNSNYYKPDFKVLVKYIRDISAVDGRMLSIQEEEARARQAIEKAAADLRIKLAARNLSSIPVSELSGAKAGIRVAALEKAGYHDLSQLAGRSETSLSMINGIGEAQAKAIRQTIDLFTRRMAETTSVRIDADSKDPENWNLVFELYKYMRKAPVYKDVADINSRYHQHIAKALSDIKIRNSLRWVFCTEWQPRLQ